ncbi:MAG: cytochrome c [Pseudomonadota bacterium]
MSETFTKAMARNIFYGGSMFFFLLLLALTFDTMGSLPQRDHRENITPAVAAGKTLWDVNNCVGCHTILGEGAYYAPELGNVYKRLGSNKMVLKVKIANPPREPGNRSMPQFNFTDEQLDNLAEFLKWTSEIDTNNWPPNIQG